jgi:hypothetical protein
MRLKHHCTCIRWLGLAWLVCGPVVVTGCQSLPFLQVHSDKVEPRKSDVAKAASDPNAANPPSKYQYALSQYVFLADFEVRHDLPLFKELVDLREDVIRTLQLPSSSNRIMVYLFDDKDRYEQFMEAKFPELPKRRAFFIGYSRTFGDELLVYTYWGNGERIEQDLRHELTHALLHSVLKTVPLWLDEGLAEYFEIPPAAHAFNAEHLKYLRHGPNGPIHPDLARLEELAKVEQMTPAEYREAWAWVHLMLHSNEDARKTLINYLKELRTTKTPAPLRPHLAAVFPTPETALERHLLVLDMRRRPGLLGN